jgi:hypothetical protein
MLLWLGACHKLWGSQLPFKHYLWPHQTEIPAAKDTASSNGFRQYWLACGTGCGHEKVEQTLRAGWAMDLVHPTGHIYVKMALNLMWKKRWPCPVTNTASKKRSDDSNSSPHLQQNTLPQRTCPGSQSKLTHDHYWERKEHSGPYIMERKAE